MQRFNAANNWQEEIKDAGGISDTDDQINVGEIDSNPIPPFKITVGDEIMNVTSISTFEGDSTLFVERGQEGTTATAHDEGEDIVNRFTAEVQNNLWDKVEDLEYPSINEQTGTAYTLALSDDGKLIACDNANPFTLTVPENSTVEFPVGTQVVILQKGDGQVTVEGEAGVTLLSVNNEVVTAKKNSIAGLIKIDTDTWSLLGDLVEGA